MRQAMGGSPTAARRSSTQVHEASEHVAENGGEIARAISQIEGGAGMRINRDLVQMGTLHSQKPLTFFAVFRGPSTRQSTHVVVGINKGGRQMIFDPQSRRWYLT